MTISLMEHDPEFGEAHALFHKLWSKSGTTAYDKKDWMALDALLTKLGLRPPGKRTDWPANRGGADKGAQHMTKRVWEETWAVQHVSELVFPGGAGIDLHDLGEDDDNEHSTTPHCEARAMLASAAPDMARVLLAIEWVTDDDDGERCPVCGGYRPGPGYYKHIQVGHSVGCALDAALRKAGVR